MRRRSVIRGKAASFDILTFFPFLFFLFLALLGVFIGFDSHESNRETGKPGVIECDERKKVGILNEPKKKERKQERLGHLLLLILPSPLLTRQVEKTVLVFSQDENDGKGDEKEAIRR